MTPLVTKTKIAEVLWQYPNLTQRQAIQKLIKLDKLTK